MLDALKCQDNVNELSDDDPERYIAIQNDCDQRKALADRDPPRGQRPMDATTRKK